MQETLKTHPELVSNYTDENNKTLLAVSEISQPIIIKSIQELDAKVVSQAEEIIMLKNELCSKDKSYSWCINEMGEKE